MIIRGLISNLAAVCLLLVVAIGQPPPQQATPSGASAMTPSTAVTPAASNSAAASGATALRPTHFVPVLISAADGNGNPMTGLTKEQLTVIDSNQAVQPLKLYAAADIPLHLGIVLLATPKTFAQQQAAAIDLAKKVLRPNVDQAFVLTARGRKPWPNERLEWARDPEQLAKAIQGLDPSAGLADAFNFDMSTAETGFDENAGRMTIQQYAGSGVTAFDAAFAMMNSDPRPSRRVIVMFRDPWAHSPGFGQRVNSGVDGAVRRITGVGQELHVTSFVVGLEDSRFNGITDNNLGKNYTSLHGGEDGGAGSASREYDRQLEQEKIQAYNAGRSNVERLATETGGAVFWSTRKNYSDAVNSIANFITGQYILTFVPTDAAGPAHTLKVTSSTGGKLLTQPLFFYGTPK